MLSNLFEQEWVSKSNVFGFSADLDGIGLKNLFSRVAQDYCVIIKGKSKKECSQDLQGCGLNDDCRLDEECRNNPSAAAGYDCISMY